MQHFKDKIKYCQNINITTFTFFIAVYVGTVLNLPIYFKIADIFSVMPSIKVGFAVSIPIFFIAAFNLIFNLFSWHFIAKPFFLLVVITSSLASYATLKYGVYFDYTMIENIFETNSSEAASYINFYSIRWFVLSGIIPALLIAWFRIDYTRSFTKFVWEKMITMLASVAIIALICVFYYKDYASVGRNNSYLNKMIVTAHIFNTVRYLDETYLSGSKEFVTMGEDARLLPSKNNKPTLMVLVVGETARSMNYQLNGYAKKTNPFTSQYDVISFNDVDSCGTATAFSLPCMFSTFIHDNYDRSQARRQDSLLDVLSYAGVGTLWKDNDGGSKGVADRIDYIATDTNKVDKNCNGSTCYDAELLEDLDDEIAQMKGDSKVVALHLIGSHGPTYWQRYPAEMAAFTPACNRSDIENCSNEAIVNTYDNTIRYTDHVVAELIEKLKGYEEKYNTALVYVSDHGESLGENGLYLHGVPYSFAPEEQTKVPLIMWLSDSLNENLNINTQCLRSNATKKRYSHDNLFHSVLGLMGVTTNLYDNELDIFGSCKNS